MTFLVSGLPSVKDDPASIYRRDDGTYFITAHPEMFQGNNTAYNLSGLTDKRVQDFIARCSDALDQ